MSASSSNNLDLFSTCEPYHDVVLQDRSNLDSDVERQDDLWLKWLLRQRHGGDPVQRAAELPQLIEIRDRVLDGARLQPGLKIADIGCGDGLIGFGALARTGNSIDVAFVDISAPLVQYTEGEAKRIGVADRCTFVVASADALASIPSKSLDVVAARAVLVYLVDKPAVLSEFFRVLKPGGRISLADPILQDSALILTSIANELRSGTYGDRTRQFELLHRWYASFIPDSIAAIKASPLTNFTERDLFRYCDRVGFSDVCVQLQLDRISKRAAPWETLLATAPIPGAPILEEVLRSYTPAERDELESFFTAVSNGGLGLERRSLAYVTAVRP